MRFHYETDPKTGKRFFNPQQDMIDQKIDQDTNSIRKYQDFMAFLYFSLFVSRAEKKELPGVIMGLEKLREILVGNRGYHPDENRSLPKRKDYRPLIRALKISKKHSLLKMRYCMRQSFDVSRRVAIQLQGGFYFQKWQAQQERARN